MKYLDKISSPDDLKQLNIKQLSVLAEEIRSFIVHSISKTGGHLASNLGVVELTIALHYCFDCPRDEIVWDVGHQSYVHKLLTGRRDKFGTLRRKDGISGFPKTEESEFDAFNTGHSSTSISAALGIAMAKELKSEGTSTVAVFGDGSMTGGLIYEAMNNARHTNSNLVIILNDNQMSISKNVGAVSKYLNALRSAPKYWEIKDDVKKTFDNVPIVGKHVNAALEKTKDSLKYALLSGKSMFEHLGIKYIGPVDGHNLEELISVMDKVKKVNGPVLLHVLTTKGKGYLQAERSPTQFHGIGGFNVKTGKSSTGSANQTYSDVFGCGLCELAGENEKIVAITAAMLSGTGLEDFSFLYPDRTFDVGIAEGHAVTFAAGLAISGMIPVFAVYSTFLQRSYDQILHDVCLQNLHVVFAVDRAGIVGEDGETHQGIYDISFLSHMPNITIMAPKNKKELEMMLKLAVNECSGPVAVRYPRGKAQDGEAPDVVYGESEIIRKGNDVAIISVGTMIETCTEVYNSLIGDGYNPTLINARFIKPIDCELVESLAGYKYIFTVEDNVRSGGYGSRLLEKMAAMRIAGGTVHNFAFGDVFVEQGTREQLFKLHGLDREGIYNKIKYILNLDKEIPD